MQQLTILLPFPLFLLFQLPSIITAVILQRRLLDSRNYYEFIAGAGFIYCGLVVIISMVLGATGLLNPAAALTTSTIIMMICWYICRKNPGQWPPVRHFDRVQGIILSLAMAFIGFRAYLNLELPPFGTDSLLYHLFFPATWLHDGQISRIPAPGLHCDYYPIYGELFYAWLMMPFYDDHMAKNMQSLASVLTFFTIAASAAGIGLSQRGALSAAMVSVFTGVILRSTNVANTDLLTGYWLVAGIVFFLLGQRRNRNWLSLSGAAFGFCAGTKYLGLLLAPAALIILLAAFWIVRPANRKWSWLPIGAAVTTASPFYIYNWITAGNPFYPVLIKIWNFTPWPNGIPMGHRDAIGIGNQTWSFFVNGDINGVSPETAIMLLAAPLLLLCMLPWRKPFSSTYARICALTLLILTGTLLLMLLRFYPVETQARQIIPTAMVACLLLITIFHLLWKGPRYLQIITMLFLLGLCFAVSYRQSSYRLLPYVVVIAAAGFVLIIRWNKFSRFSKLALIITIPIMISYGIGDKIYRLNQNRTLIYSVIFPPDAIETIAAIEQLTKDRPTKIAYCGGAGYSLTGVGYANRLEYIPITTSGSQYSHDYPTEQAIRTPGDYEQWLARLRQKQVGYLVCDYSSFPAKHNQKLEAAWAATHPAEFKPVLATVHTVIFELLPSNK